MSKTIEQILGYVALTGVIKAVTTGIPDVLPKAFQTIKKQVPGIAGRYTQITGTRQTATISMYGSPARKRALRDIASKDVKLLHSFENITMAPLLLQTLRNYDNYDMQNLGIQEVDRQQSEFRAYFDNLRLSCQYSMLSLGHVYYDGDGNLLPTSSGAVVDVDFQIPANNQNQLNGIITASWALANTDIPAQLRALRLRAAQLTGYPLKYAFYGLNVPSYMTQNNYVIDYLARNPNFAQKFLEQAEIPDGLFGFTWVPVYTAFYEDASNTNQTFFSSDAVIFTPEIDSTVYELMEGSFMVPTSFNASANMASALGSLKQVYGMGSFAVPTMNPPTCEMYFFDQQLPVWKVPNSMFQADCTP